VFNSATIAVPPVGAVPRHVAIIMDGNGRWAKSRFLPRVAGHKRGLEAVRTVTKACVTQGVRYLTLFAFSSMTASSARCFGAPREASWSPRTASTGPSRRNSVLIDPIKQTPSES
jgi:hypothetical protein